VKLYIIIPDSLDASYRLPQVGHAIADAFLKWGTAPAPELINVELQGIFYAWANDHKSIVIWELDSELFQFLVQRVEDLSLHQDITVWREPDMNDTPTALAIRPMYENEVACLLMKSIYLEPGDMILA